MKQVNAYGASSAQSKLTSMTIARREPGPGDVEIDIQYCGVCHSDLHQVRDEWSGAIFPMVPGHEIIGTVRSIGTHVTAYKVGDLVGVGCMVDSCHQCPSCHDGYEQFCEKGFSPTYNGYEQDGATPTYGGYATSIVTDQRFVLRIDKRLNPASAAPLLCAGITTYSPLRHWNVGPDSKVGIVGLGGLGHMGIQFARAMGAQVVTFTTTASKAEDARKLGSHEVVVGSQAELLDAHSGSFDFILDTVSAPHDLGQYFQLLKRDGTLCLVGVPPEGLLLQPFDIVMKRRSLAGSLIGGIKETQEMLDFCAENGIESKIELLAMPDIEQAYERMQRGDVKYRFVIDMSTLPTAAGT